MLSFPPYDKVGIFQGEREAVWNRIGGAQFLTLNERRAAAGYGPVPGGDVLSDGSTPL